MKLLTEHSYLKDQMAELKSEMDGVRREMAEAGESLDAGVA